jgi:hypothetical protein
MTPEQHAHLLKIIDGQFVAYSETARSILNSPGQWSEVEVAQFIDAYLNDPNLSRND